MHCLPRFALLALVSILAAAPALAQHGSMATSVYNERSDFSPEFSARDLKVMVGVLDLKPTEQDALNALYDAYAATLRTEGAAVRETITEALERAEIMNDSTLLTPARAAITEWRKRSESIKAAFLADLKSLLTREQESRWPILERELRRIKRIAHGRLTGEDVDLVRLVEDVLEDSSAGTPPPVAELLARYREELDRALVARDAYLEQEQAAYQTALKEDPQRAEAIWREARRLRTTVRDCNDRFARQIAPELPVDIRTVFETRHFELSFPMLAKDSRTDTYLKDAAELPSLTAEQKQQMGEVAARHQRHRSAWFREAAAAWRLYEEDSRPSDLALALGEEAGVKHRQQYNGAWLDDAHPLTASRRARFELDRATRAAIDRVLTLEQREDVPSRVSPMARFDDWSPYGL